MNDFKFALRLLTKSPLFTLISVVSLAIGIGATTTVFCWMKTTLMQPLPGVRNAGEMIVVLSQHASGATYETVSLPDIQDLRSATNVFAGIIGSQITPACLNLNGKPEWIYGQIATANFFDLLGVKATHGSTFLPEPDQQPGNQPVLVISHGLWQRLFGGNPNVVGQTVELNRRAFTIIGVAPEKFRGTMSGLMMDFWAPLSMHREVARFGNLSERGDRWLHTQARLHAGVTLSQTQAAADTVAQQLATAYTVNQKIKFNLRPLWKAPYGGQSLLLPVMGFLMAVSLFVLLIVAANIANLLLARAAARTKEIAIRLAMGAGRLRLVRQLLAESLTLAFLGGAAGIIVSIWTTQLLEQIMPTTYLPIGYSFEIDGQVLAFTLLVTLATGVIFGIAPAVQTARHAVYDTLKEGGRQSAAGASMHWLRNTLVVSEVAMAMLLLVGAGLCYKGFQMAKKTDPGFDPRHVLGAGMRLAAHNYDEPRGKVFYRELFGRLNRLPGAESAAFASYIPLGFEGGGSFPVQVEGYVPSPNEHLSVPVSLISGKYFETMRIPLLDGRDFNEQDDENAPGVAIINETMAKRFWPGQNPIGRKLNIPDGRRNKVVVVGIVKNGKYRTLGENPQSFLYLHYLQGISDLNLGIVMRTRGAPGPMAGPLRKEIQSLDAGVAVWATITLEDYTQAAYLANKIAALLISVLGLTALLLAAMGLYGVMAYLVSQRTHEIGIRMALGAQINDILKLVIHQGMTLVAIGGITGLIGSLGLGMILSHYFAEISHRLLLGATPYDLGLFLVTISILGLVTLAACYLPARNAAKVDPMITLHYE